jgi:aarF domain-containing kinase
MSDDEDLAALMSSLRGDHLNQDDFAAAGQQVSLLASDTESLSGHSELPLSYDIVAISEFWSIRPVSVMSRIVHLATISSDFIMRIVWDIVTGQVQDNQVRRAIQIRNIVTSLGPAYIKVCPETLWRHVCLWTRC